MLLYPITLLLSFPVALTYDKLAYFRNRRVPVSQSGFGGGGGGVHTKRNPPFIIRVPYSKILPSNALFSHSVSWKAKQTPPAAPSSQAAVSATATDAVVVKSADESGASSSASSSSALPDLEVSQFHAQDTNGQVVFGFNAPDQMRVEQRNADGTVHGTYSYLDPYGHIIKRQYWDTGAGFHVTSDSYPFNDASINVNGGENFRRQNLPGVGAVQYTPEVQAARDLHFQLYQQALASFLPNANSSPQNDLRRNGSVNAQDGGGEGDSNNSTTDNVVSWLKNATTVPAPGLMGALKNNTSTSETSTASPTTIATMTSATPLHLDSDGESVVSADQDSIDVVEPDTENGSIVIQKPEYLRISWTTENKKHRVNSGTNNEDHDSERNNDNNLSAMKSAMPTTTTTGNLSQPVLLSSSHISNVTKFIIQGGK